MRDFHGTGIEIWAGFGLIGSTEKRVWAVYEQHLYGTGASFEGIFSCFHGQKKC